MRSREFINEVNPARLRRIIIQPYNSAKEGLVYILKGPNGEVTNPAGQTLTYPSRDAAATARDKMADPSAVQGNIDYEKKAPNAMAAGEAGRVGSGSFSIPSRDPATNELTQKIKIKEKDADGKVSEKIIIKTYKGWLDFAVRTDLWPAGSWRPGYLMQTTKLITSRMPFIGYFFTVGDIALIGKILNDWRMELDAIQLSYERNDYYIIQGNGRQQAELEMKATNKEYIIKLTKAVATIMAANITGAFVKQASSGKITAGSEIANGLVQLFKLGGKKVNPSIIKTLTAGGLEAAKLFSAAWVSNAEFKNNVENAFVRGIIETGADLAGLAASVIQWPVFGDLDLSIGTLSAADDAAMRKNAALNKEPETTGAAPAGTPPKGPIDRAIDQFKAP